ncbi:hypothetical protein LTR40_005313 [Exophiala xenobiotica]|nr:hypothetical protein LTR40_005313 [Exophiala xenobiotica]
MYGSVHRDSVLESAERIAHEQRMAYYPPPAPPYMQPYPGYMPYYAPQQQFDQMQLGGRPQASPGYPAGSERAPQMPAYGHPQPPPPYAKFGASDDRQSSARLGMSKRLRETPDNSFPNDFEIDDFLHSSDSKLAATVSELR